MAAKKTGLGVLTVAFALTVVGVAPASAEFFGCNEPRTKVSYSTRPVYSPAPRQRTTTRYTHEFAAQRSRQRGAQHVTNSTRRAHRSYRADNWR